MSRTRVRGAAYRARRIARHAGRRVVIDEPLPNGRRRVTEFRRGVSVAVCHLDDGQTIQFDAGTGIVRLNSTAQLPALPLDGPFLPLQIREVVS